MDNDGREDGIQPNVLGQEGFDIEMENQDEEDVLITDVISRERPSPGADTETAEHQSKTRKEHRDHPTHPDDPANTDSEALKQNRAETLLAGGPDPKRHRSAGMNFEDPTQRSEQSRNGTPGIEDRLGRSKSTFAALPPHNDSSPPKVVPKRRVPNAQVLATLQKRMHLKNAANSKSTTGSMTATCTPLRPVPVTGRGGRLSEQPPPGPEPHDEASSNSDTSVADSPRDTQAVNSPRERPESILIPDENDHSWMAQTHNPDDDVNEAKAMNKKADALRVRIKRKAKQKKPHLEEEIALIQVERELARHSRRVRGDKNM